VPGKRQSGEGTHGGAAVCGGLDRSRRRRRRGFVDLLFLFVILPHLIQRAPARPLDLLLPSILAVSSFPFEIFFDPPPCIFHSRSRFFNCFCIPANACVIWGSVLGQIGLTCFLGGCKFSCFTPFSGLRMRHCSLIKLKFDLIVQFVSCLGSIHELPV
jgi:hypothetical protein